jgi:hypothetical protein
MQQNKFITPPRVKWIHVSERMPSNDCDVMLFGRVNVGSPHEAYCAFNGKYFADTNAKFFDKHGDDLGSTYDIMYWGHFEYVTI